MSKIVNISEAASLALHSLALIAKSEKMINVIEISKNMNFSKNHLSKILQVLVRNDYLKSIRGPKGGFELKKKAQEITLLEIYEIFEGKIACHTCAMKNNEKCTFNNCIFGYLPGQFSKEFEDYLRNTSIADLIVVSKY